MHLNVRSRSRSHLRRQSSTIPGLTAALTPKRALEDRAVSGQVAESNLAEAYQKAARAWAEQLPLRLGARPSQEDIRAFGAAIRTALQSTLTTNVVDLIKTEFDARELPLPTQAQLDRMSRAAVRRTLRNNEVSDIAGTLYRAKRFEGRANEGANTAGYSLDRLLGEAHAKEVTGSLFRTAVDDVEQQAFKRAEKLKTGLRMTGRRKWVAGPGRHHSLNGVIAEKGEGWKLPERSIGSKTLSAKRVIYPRQNPRDVSEWSGSTSFVQYEVIDEEGEVRWL